MAGGVCAQRLGGVLERRHGSRDVGVLTAAVVADSEAGLVMEFDGLRCRCSHVRLSV